MLTPEMLSQAQQHLKLLDLTIHEAEMERAAIVRVLLGATIARVPVCDGRVLYFQLDSGVPGFFIAPAVADPSYRWYYPAEIEQPNMPAFEAIRDQRLDKLGMYGFRVTRRR